MTHTIETSLLSKIDFNNDNDVIFLSYHYDLFYALYEAKTKKSALICDKGDERNYDFWDSYWKFDENYQKDFLTIEELYIKEGTKYFNIYKTKTGKIVYEFNLGDTIETNFKFKFSPVSEIDHKFVNSFVDFMMLTKDKIDDDTFKMFQEFIYHYYCNSFQISKKEEKTQKIEDNFFNIADKLDELKEAIAITTAQLEESKSYIREYMELGEEVNQKNIAREAEVYGYRLDELVELQAAFEVNICELKETDFYNIPDVFGSEREKQNKLDWIEGQISEKKKLIETLNEDIKFFRVIKGNLFKDIISHDNDKIIQIENEIERLNASLKAFKAVNVDDTLNEESVTFEQFVDDHFWALKA